MIQRASQEQEQNTWLLLEKHKRELTTVSLRDSQIVSTKTLIFMIFGNVLDILFTYKFGIVYDTLSNARVRKELV